MGMSNINVRDQTQLIRYLLRYNVINCRGIKRKSWKAYKKRVGNRRHDNSVKDNSLIISCLIIKFKYYYLYFLSSYTTLILQLDENAECFSFIWNVIIQFLRLLQWMFFLSRLLFSMNHNTNTTPAWKWKHLFAWRKCPCRKKRKSSYSVIPTSRRNRIYGGFYMTTIRCMKKMSLPWKKIPHIPLFQPQDAVGLYGGFNMATIRCM